MKAVAPAAAAPTTLRVLEKLHGRGEVYDGEHLLADVEYSLREVEDVSRAVSAPGSPAEGGPSDLVVGERSVYGVVRCSEGNILSEYVGVRLVVQLEDGRRLDCAVAKVMPPHHVLIQGLARADVLPRASGHRP